MPSDATRVLYSAKDLINFLGCEHSTALDLELRAGRLPSPKPAEDEYLDLLKEKGLAHERAFLETLRRQGKTIREIDRGPSFEAMTEATRQAMRDGDEVIYQGALVSAP